MHTNKVFRSLNVQLVIYAKLNVLQSHLAHTFLIFTFFVTRLVLNVAEDSTIDCQRTTVERSYLRFQ